MPAFVKPGRIDSIEISNFKSYKGTQVIGPFKNFTAIIGPNGAGKSNLMDAISFVLGVKSMQLRGSQLKDLIYAFDDSEREKKGRKAFVKLIYHTGAGEELHLTRGITGAGASEYRVDDRVVTWDEYNNKMKSLGILAKARNFLVFQGDVESIASKNPKELTALFEQISGSEELKAEYEDLQAKKKSADEAAAFSFTKKKSVTAERKQKKEQKEEAERHLQLEKDLKDTKTQHSLWQLYTIENNIQRTEAVLAEVQEELQEARKVTSDFDAKMAEQRKLHALHKKQLASCEKRLGKKNAEIEKRRPDEVKSKEEIKHFQKKIHNLQKDLEKKRGEQQKQAKDAESFERLLQDVTAQLQALSEESLEGGEKLQMAESQVREYRKMKEEAGTKTSKFRSERDVIAREQRADIESMKTTEVELQQLDAREKELKEKMEKEKDVVQEKTKELEHHKQERAAAVKEAEKTKESHRRANLKKETLTTKLESIEKQLKDLKADRRESARDTKFAETLTNLKKLFPGVHGRMSELCKPREKKYYPAVSIVMANNFDAVVVDDEKVAKDCIEFLREQRQPPVTFIPLLSARVKPIQERLRALGGTSKLLIDVIEYEAQYETAMLYALANTLVCDSVDEAKMLAWGPERQKVIALDGTLLGKTGTMTGGMNSNMEQKSSRWDNRAIESLKEQRDKLIQEIASIPPASNLVVLDQQTKESMASFDRSIMYCQTQLKVGSGKIKSGKAELETIQQRKATEAPKLEEMRGVDAVRSASLHRLDAEIRGIEDRIFSAFSMAVGVENIQEYEEKRLAQQEQIAKRKLDLTSTKAKLENQLQFQHSHDTAGPVSRLEHQVGEVEGQLEGMEEKAAGVRAVMEEAKEAIEALNEEKNECLAAVVGVEQHILALKSDASDIIGRVAKLKRDSTQAESEVESLKVRQSGVLESCELDEIRLHFAEGETVPMEVDSGGPVGRGAALDYSGLKPAYKQDMDDRDLERVEIEFRSKMEALSSEIVRTLPNLKALDQYESIRDKERQAIQDLEATQREAKRITDKFVAVKQERYSRFTTAFHHVSESICVIYKELTQSHTHPIGGTAYLSVENDDDPFLGGIRFNAMPPTKRFRDMEQMSGGEKTVAALALLFAIHSFQPSPFFVLDEVDAALDNLNVAKVAGFIHNRSRDVAMQGGGGGFQGVVISLKDQFYDKADALVGVYRDSDQSCSKTLTFDLGKFP